MTTGRKVMVLGLDGMEPYTAKRLMDAGKMPNLKKMVENGAARENLELLGSMPTITLLSGPPSLAAATLAYTV